MKLLTVLLVSASLLYASSNIEGTYKKSGSTIIVEKMKYENKDINVKIFTKTCKRGYEFGLYKIKTNTYEFAEGLYESGSTLELTLTFGKNGLDAKAYSALTNFNPCVDSSDYLNISGHYKKTPQKKSVSSGTKMTDDEYLAYKHTYPQYAAADKQLNQTFSKLRMGMNNTQKNELKNNQNTWIVSRDQRLFEAGPKGSQAYIDLLIQLTTERTNYLQSLLKQ